MSDQRTACADNPVGWDMDSGTPAQWYRAKIACNACPLLPQCQTQLAEMVAANCPPRSMIWAGIAYSNYGRPIENLGRYAADRDKTTHISNLRMTA